MSFPTERQLAQRLLAQPTSDEHATEASRPHRGHDFQEVERALSIEPMELAAREIPKSANGFGTVQGGESERVLDGERLARAVDRAERLLRGRARRLREWLGDDYDGPAR